ncbi:MULTISPECIES: hypothetical protein [Leptolyngbya]|uniref:hypothetical protein n=1 Tax=Leptolyngbya TaxID=47251 RepID=UPI0016873A4F|nr:hypothetical protein [Leptolyngbya sp. FACHB-1624]MBD1857720.1 hypothetical protein [Leptolyngbya sp. FACHB-1624]
MTQQEIVEALRKRGFKQIEIENDVVLADFGIENEYWVIIQPDSDEEWLHCTLQSHTPETLRDGLYQSLDEALFEFAILATVDFAKFHEQWRLRSTR